MPQLFSFVRLLTSELHGSSRRIGTRNLARESRQLGSLTGASELDCIPLGRCSRARLVRSSIDASGEVGKFPNNISEEVIFESSRRCRRLAGRELRARLGRGFHGGIVQPSRRSEHAAWIYDRCRRLVVRSLDRHGNSVDFIGSYWNGPSASHWRLQRRSQRQWPTTGAAEALSLQQ